MQSRTNTRTHKRRSQLWKANYIENQRQQTTQTRAKVHSTKLIVQPYCQKCGCYGDRPPVKHLHIHVTLSLKAAILIHFQYSKLQLVSQSQH